MNVSKEHVQLISYLVGFHSFRKDHNYGNYKADLINDLQLLVNDNFEILKIGGLDILRTGLNDAFEIRLTPNTLLYQNNIGFEESKVTSQKMLELWVKYSPIVRLSLVGIVFNFRLSLDKPTQSNHLRLKDSYLKQFSLGNKILGMDLRFNYALHFKGCEYNANILLAEKNEKEYFLQGSLDFHKISDDKMNGIPHKSCDKLFDYAKEYFESEFFDFLNLEIA